LPDNATMPNPVAAPTGELPVDSVLDELRHALAASVSAVLIAPPGAGKTTKVPLALDRADFLSSGTIIVLEPRRLAARAAAQYVAHGLGERLGETIGLRVRLQSLISAQTRIEFVTDGVFARMIVDDPALSGVAAVIFDEFHERSLDGDLGLALCLETQAAWRPDLRILIMSATLDGARVGQLLGPGTPLIVSEGRAFPVDTHYLGRDARLPLEAEIVQVVVCVLGEQRGSILVFLPGQSEIRRVAQRLSERITDPHIDIAPLYSSLDRASQDTAVAPTLPGRRKIVLATSIAETSLTIDGIRIVIDSGFARRPRYEPDLGLTRLETMRVSRAEADQRRGRAGRLEPGICYRLWEQAATASFEPFARPEILSGDLSGLALDLAEWGVSNASELAFLDPPPPAALAAARQLLQDLGALDFDHRITADGRAIRALPLPPRLARMVLLAARHNEATARKAAEIATVLVERGLGGEAIDIEERIEALTGDRSQRGRDARKLIDSFVRQARPTVRAGGAMLGIGALVALAYPDRIARARGKPGDFLLANGRAASVALTERLAGAPFLAVAEVSGRAAATRILAAAALTLAEVDSIFAEKIAIRDELAFDRTALALRARRVRRLGEIVLSEQNLPAAGQIRAAEALAKGIAAVGLERLPFTKALRQWLDRVAFLRRTDPTIWPDLSDEALKNSASLWLAPFLDAKSELSEITAADLDQALKAQLPWSLARQLDDAAPTHFVAPTGSRLPIDYRQDGTPGLAVRVQELFGLSRHPSIVGGKIPLALHLLSPAHRTIQITKDLPGFWAGSWAAVRSEMKGRYPRHPWPEDPLAAPPTARAKPRGT
jgi:ATP-dependent helicase HrpB